MERPTKRQKLSDTSYLPTRTLDLNDLQRQPVRRQTRILLPRRPDVTITAGLLEVAVNEGSIATQISLPTSQVAVPIGSLGTLTLPGLTTASTLSTHNSTSFSTLSASNSTTTQRTVTVTAVSTFHVSYKNGTFIAPSTLSSSSSDDTTTTETNTYVFGQGVTDTYTRTTAPTQPMIHTSTSPASSSSPTTSSTPVVPPLTPQQSQMVGGIVGGVAGIALVIIALLYVLRWWRARLKSLPTDYNINDKLVTGAAPMSSSRTLAKKLHPASEISKFTSTTSLDSEKGFTRLSGRKIAPVLSSGGDQYGGSYGVFEKEIELVHTRPQPPHDLRESSFYRDEEGVHVGNGVRSAPTMLDDISTALANSRQKGYEEIGFSPSRPDGVAVFRGSPARTPVTQSPDTVSMKMPIQAPVTMDEDIPEMPLPSPNLVVRNFSRGGSRASSRFREEIH